MPTWLKITLALYGVVLVSNLALRHAVLNGAADPWGKLGWGIALLVSALIWAAGLSVWLLIHRKGLSTGERTAGWLSVGFSVLLLFVVAIAWGSIGA